MRKAGYIVPPDGVIRLDGGIDSIGIKGDIDLKMSNPRRDEVSVLFETMVNEEKINAYYILDHQLTLRRRYYSYIRNQKKRKCEHLSSRRRTPIKDCSKRVESFSR